MKNKLIALFYKYLAYPLLKIYWYTFRPKTQGVKVIIKHKNQLLFVKNTYHSQFWNFPGGGVKTGEKPKAAAIREIGEEVGIKLNNLKLCGNFIYKGDYKIDHIYVFSSTTKTPDFEIDPTEIKTAKWFRISDLKNLKLTTVVKTSLKLAALV